MSEPFYAGAYWGDRPEPVERCAERLGACLAALGATHPALKTWYRKGRSKAAASRAVAAEKAIRPAQGPVVAYPRLTVAGRVCHLSDRWR